MDSNFKKELQQLLNKYKAEISLEELPHAPYIPANYTIRCYVNEGDKDFTLGSYMSWENS